MGKSVLVAWTEQQPLRGGKHWTVQTALEHLHDGNAPKAGDARPGRGLASAVATLEHQLLSS